MCFLELQRAILVHNIFIFAPLASLMRNLAQGAAQKNPWNTLYSWFDYQVICQKYADWSATVQILMILLPQFGLDWFYTVCSLFAPDWIYTANSNINETGYIMFNSCHAE